MIELQRGLIISCQLEPGDPIQDPCFIVNMAIAAESAGAIAIRTNGPVHVSEVKRAVKLPIIGLVKDRSYETFITPTYDHARSVIDAGAHFVALDCTRRKRPEPIETLFQQIRQYHPNIGIIADISDLEDAFRIYELKPDFFATTLAGYTDYTKDRTLPDFDLVKTLVREFDIPVIAEGGFSSPKQVQKAMEIGAYAVVVGTAITRPWVVIKRFNEAISKFL